ncbi:hypothetical protein ACFV7R_44605 [Streptomyces sp. NPDC059866]|uniref:8-oxoguanine DNA glycosylase OGG fold protein n=1 Tax=Streptomyces sp. NPDC059866 TaxID=3346978 RepID=UPI00364774CE
MLQRPLPPDAAVQLGAWLAGNGAQYAGEIGAHAVGYVPAAWAGIEPWPALLADRTGGGRAAVSRAQVMAVARAGAVSSSWRETLVASYVWGQGGNGYGPHRLGQILHGPSVQTQLARAVAMLADEGAVAAYRSLRGAIPGLGPAFFTKFLYFAGAARLELPGPRPLILDQRIARVVRAYAIRVGQKAGLAEPAGLAGWLWSDGGWTAHRYDIYLGWMHAATGQLAATTHWPFAPDLLELALFGGAWNPA